MAVDDRDDYSFCALRCSLSSAPFQPCSWLSRVVTGPSSAPYHSAILSGSTKAAKTAAGGASMTRTMVKLVTKILLGCGPPGLPPGRGDGGKPVQAARPEHLGAPQPGHRLGQGGRLQGHGDGAASLVPAHQRGALQHCAPGWIAQRTVDGVGKAN